MTTIAMKTAPNGRVRIAWDTQSTSGNVASSHNRTKVVAVNGQIAVGVSGRVRYANLVQRVQIPPIDPRDLGPDFDAEGWVISELVPQWMHEVKMAWGHTPHEEGDEIPWGVALTAIAGKVIQVGSDFSVIDRGEFGAIGSGGDFAMAAMHLGKTPEQAVDVARELDLFSGGRTEGMTL